MGGLSIWHILALAAIALLIFGGGGRIADIMGDFGKGVRNFRKGLSAEQENAAHPQISDQHADQTVSVTKDTVQHS
jgi:sec-independent protein translocase protein TatA